MRSMFLRVVVLAGLLAVASLTIAQDKVRPKADAKPKTAAKVDYSEVAAGGPGVSNVVRDKKGRILSVLIVGRSRISTVLGATKGKEIATRRASIAADAEFSKWLGTKIDVRENASDETTLFLEGAEDNDKDAMRESGKSVEKTSAEYKRTSSAFVRGLQIVHREVNGKTKELTIVKKWRSSLADSIENIGKKPEKKPVDKKKPTDKKIDKKPGKKTDKTIEDEKTTIKE